MLKQRVISAVVALLLVALAVWQLPKESLRWIVFGLWCLGAWEWSGFVKPNKPILRSVYTIWLGSLFFMAATGFFNTSMLQGLLVSGLLFWGFALIKIFQYPAQFSKPFTLLAGIFVLLPSYAAFDYLFKQPEYNLWYVIYPLLIIWGADVGAYFVGKRFGKTKLAPSISPGKTREGAFGGWILACIVAITFAPLLFENFGLRDVMRVAVAGSAIFLLSVIGDLTVSMFKRNVDLKDSGVFLPGHGGVLDRIDSWCSGIVLFVLILLFFH